MTEGQKIPSPLEILNSWMGLERYVKKAAEMNAELAAGITKRGACDRRGWLQAYMQDDALGIVAQQVIDALGRGETAEAVESALTERFEKEVSYIIPTNSDTDAAIYKVQALQRVRDELRWAIKSERGER